MKRKTEIEGQQVRKKEVEGARMKKVKSLHLFESGKGKAIRSEEI